MKDLYGTWHFDQLQLALNTARWAVGIGSLALVLGLYNLVQAQTPSGGFSSEPAIESEDLQ